MIIIALLIGISLTIALGFLVVFIWNVKSGQYDDTYTPSVRMLFDSKAPQVKEKVKTQRSVNQRKVLAMENRILTDKNQFIDRQSSGSQE